MGVGLRRLAGLAIFVSLLPPSAALAQQVLDSYIAVIGAQDRFNSSGVPLTQADQILTQDRANFHRFQIRQSGDTSDQTFVTTEQRARMVGLIANGLVDPAATQLILFGQEAPLLVEVLGANGSATALRVSPVSTSLQQTTTDIVAQHTFEETVGCMDISQGTDTRPCILPDPASGAQRIGEFGQPEPVNAPAQDSPATVPATTDGNDAVQAAIFGWALAQNPEAATVPQHQQFAPHMSLPIDAPQPPERGITGPEFEVFLKNLAAYYANEPTPSRIRIEFPASVRRHEMRDGYRLYSSGRDIEGVHALTELSLNWRQLSSTYIWRSERPFYLPLPESFVPPDLETGGTNVRDRLMLSVVLTMSNPIIEARGGLFRTITSDADIEEVSLIRRTEHRVQGQFQADPDRLVLRWTDSRGEATTTGPLPTDPAGMIAVFGGAVSAGRYVPEWDTNSSKGRSLGAATGIINKGQQTRSIETALAFGALLTAGPDRTISAEAAHEAIRYVLTETEAYELFPVAYVSNPDAMNEIERRAALEAAQPGLRAILTGRTPRLPMQVRDVIIATVGDYDFTLMGFPLRGQNGRWLPKDPLTGQEITDLVPNFLPMPEAEASNLLTTLEQLGAPSRTLFVAVDYTLEQASVRAAASGPISTSELALVRLGSRIDAVTLYADAALTLQVGDPITEVPQNAGELSPLPDEVFATTGKSLLGAMGHFLGGEAAIGEVISERREVVRAPVEQRERLVASMAQDIIEAARDEYWIGAQWNLQAYDAGAGGYPVRSVQFRSVPHQDDVSGFSAPPLQGEASHAYEVLRIAPERREAFEAYLDLDRAGRRDGMQLTSNIRVRPVGIIDDRSGAILVVSAPFEIMLGQSHGNGLVLTDDDRFTIAAPPRLGPATNETLQITPPEVLVLDHEGIDLLAISLAPDHYDDGSFERMLIERLLKERAFAGAVENVTEPGALSWGSFFEDPARRLTEPEIERLVPLFREWTLARATQLPSRVAIPLSFETRWHPDTGCIGMTEIRASVVGRRNTAVFDEVSSHMPEALLPEDGMSLGQGAPSRQGPDRYWVSEGRAVLGDTRADCGYVQRQIGRDSDIAALSEGPYADLLVHIKAQPTPPGPGRAASATYVAEIDEVDFALANPARMDGASLVGVVRLSVTPVALTKHVRNAVGVLELADPIGPEDWKVPEAVAPQALDVVGLTLGMPLAEFEAAVRQKISDPVVFVPAREMEGLFGAAKGFLDTDTQEAFLAIYARDLAGQPVIGIMRRIEVPTGRGTPAALRQSLEAKYGAPAFSQGERYMLWGTLPEGEDQLDFCGGISTVSSSRGSQIPQMTTQQIDRFESEYSLPRHDFWFAAGWPLDKSDGPAYAMKDPSRCGPVVAASLFVRDEGSLLGVLLFDRKMAEMQRHAPAIALEIEEADVEL